MFETAVANEPSVVLLYLVILGPISVSKYIFGCVNVSMAFSLGSMMTFLLFSP